MNSPRVLLLLVGISLLFSGATGRSQDWQPTSAPSASWARVAASADGSRLVALTDFNGSPGGIYTSTNAGVNWQLSLAFPGDDLAISADGMTWFVGRLDIGCVIHRNWGALETWPGLLAGDVACSANGTTLVGASGSVQFSTNSGATWTTPVEYLTNGNFNEISTSVALSADGRTALVGTTGNFVYLTTNAGLSWKASVVNGNQPGPVKAVASAADGSELLAASNDGVFVSRDAGATWQLLKALPNIEAICCSADAGRIAAVTSSGEIHLSLDSGADWTYSTPAGTGARFISIACSGDGTRFVAAVNGGAIYTSQVPSAPKLKMVISQTNVTLSWPYPSDGFRLQESTNLTDNRWSDVVLPSRIPGTNWLIEITLPRTAPPRFYRLLNYKAFKGTFINLDFELATLVPIPSVPPPWPVGPTYLEFPPAFPGWTGYIHTNVASLALSNTVFLDVASISLHNTSTTYSPWSRAEGKYFAGIEAGISTNFVRADTFIAQTGTIDSRVRSLQFRTRLGVSEHFAVTLGGEPLTLIPWYVESDTTIYRADISRFSGRTVELRVTIFAAPPPSLPVRFMYLDDIVFSPATFP